MGEAHADVVNAQHDAMVGKPGGELTGLRNVPGVEFEPATGEQIADAMGVPYEWVEPAVVDERPQTLDEYIRERLSEAFQERAWSERTPAQRAIDVLRATPPPRLADRAVEGLGVAGIIRDMLRENPRLDGVPVRDGWEWGYEHRRDPATRGHHDIANGRGHDWVGYPLDWPCTHGPERPKTGGPAKSTWQGLRWIDRHKPTATYWPPSIGRTWALGGIITVPEMKPGDVLVGSFSHGFANITFTSDPRTEEYVEHEPEIKPVEPAPRSWWRRVLDLVRPRR
jgi:hypothetical protein